MQALRILPVAIVLLATGCFFNKPSETVVNAGDSTPISEREDARSWEGVSEHSWVVAYEVGRCETNEDCVPRGCDDAVCSPVNTDLVCMTSQVGSCLARNARADCGCVEGVCRWARTPRVMQCAAIAEDRAGTRPYAGSEGEAYPNPPGY